MLSFIPLVLFGSLAAAAFVDDGDDTEDQAHTGEDRDDAAAHDLAPEGGGDLVHDVMVDSAESAAPADVLSDLDLDDSEPLVLMSPLMGSDMLEEDEDDATEVVNVEIDDEVMSMFDAMPGPETGFRATLSAEDELELNIADDVGGRVATVQAVHDIAASDGAGDTLIYSLNFYVVPDDVALPDTGYEGSEEDFINTFEAQKLGEVDLGRFETTTNPDTGDTEIAEDSRQTDPPRVLSNRDVVVMDALFT